MTEQTAGVKKAPVIEIPVSKCQIHSVVVYRDRAAVKRVVHAHLLPGENKVVVNGLAEAVKKESIGVEGEGAAKITDVIFNTTSVTKVTGVPQDGSTKVEYERIVAEKEERLKEIKHLQLKEGVLMTEKFLLATYAGHVSKVQSLKSSEGSEDSTLAKLFSDDAVKMVMEFYNSYEGKVASLDQSIREVQDSIKKLNGTVMVLQANAASLDPRATKQTTTTETVRSVHIGLDANKETDVSLYVSYVVFNASWSPSYDVRVLPDDKLMRVQYFGHIKQSTGEDWANASISLSTAQPSLGGSPPTLGEHTIKFASQRYSYGSSSPEGKRKKVMTREFYADHLEASVEDMPQLFQRERRLSLRLPASRKREKERGGEGGGGGDDSGSDIEVPAVEVETAKVSSGLFNTTYAIQSACNIPSDGAEHKVTVAFIDLRSELTYVAVPSLSPYCFLKSNVNNSSPFAILAGPANIFLVNNFVAKSNLRDVSPNEYFNIHLGVDQSIRITTHPTTIVRGNTRSLTRQSNQTISSTHVIDVKNTKETGTVKVNVTDQLPLSTDERIKVTLVEPNLKRPAIPYGSVTLKPNANNLEWMLDLPPETEVSLKVEYLIEYPPNFFVAGLPK